MAHLRKVTLLAIVPTMIAPMAFVALGGMSTSGCEAYHNEKERLEYKQYQDAQEAKLYPAAEKQKLEWPGYNPPDPTKCPNNNTCLPDPGSRPVGTEECAAIEGDYEFMPISIWDFEDDRGMYDDWDKNRQREQEGLTKDKRLWEPTNTSEKFALYGYTYKDDTTNNSYPFGWEPPAIPDPTYAEDAKGQRSAAPRCGIEDNHVFHIAGGPFIEWGGGLGRALRCMNNTTWDDTNPGQAAINAWRSKYANEPDASGYLETDVIYCRNASVKTKPSVPFDLPYSACGMTPDKAKEGGVYADVWGICPERDRLYKDPKTRAKVPPEELALVGQAIDASQWDGISFWARRGPNGQSGIRVLVGDKRTDDDMSFLQYVIDPETPRYCERTIECACKSATRPCTKVDEKEAWLFNSWVTSGRTDVALQPEPTKKGQITYKTNAYNLKPLLPGESICWDRNDTEGTTDDPIQIAARNFQFCGDSATKHQTDSGKSMNMGYDPFIFDTKCQEYSFRGSITSKYAYNPESKIPAQQKPAEIGQQCGDHWMRSIDLSLDWQFYTVPFKTLFQQGWSKRSYELDLTALTLIRLTWDRGYIDYYIDDVRFYRTKKSVKSN